MPTCLPASRSFQVADVVGHILGYSMVVIRNISISHCLVVIIVTVCLCSLCFGENEDYEACYDQSDPLSPEAAKCHIRLYLERNYESEMLNYLKKTSDMNNDQIYSLIRRMNKQRAECEVDALVKFSTTRTDIPLDLLLRIRANLTVSDEERIWLNEQFFDLSPFGTTLHCEDEYFGTIGWKRPGLVRQ